VSLELANGVSLEELTLEQMRSVEPRIDQSVFTALDLETVVDARDNVGGPARSRVMSALAAARAALKE
jgi:argininosuccinate lyase